MACGEKYFCLRESLFQKEGSFIEQSGLNALTAFLKIPTTVRGIFSMFGLQTEFKSSLKILEDSQDSTEHQQVHQHHNLSDRLSCKLAIYNSKNMFSPTQLFTVN